MEENEAQPGEASWQASAGTALSPSILCVQGSTAWVTSFGSQNDRAGTAEVFLPVSRGNQGSERSAALPEVIQGQGQALNPG